MAQARHSQPRPRIGSAREFVQHLAHRFVTDQIPGRAAQMSFYFFLSMFPTLLILMGVLELFLDAQWLVRDTLLERLGELAPQLMVDLFRRLLSHLADRRGVPLPLGIAVALWAASSGMVATIRGLNVAYDVQEERSWWKRRLVALALMLALMLLATVALVLVAYGTPLAQSLAHRAGWDPQFAVPWKYAQWPLVFGFVLLAFELLYHYAPNRPRQRWKWLRPGTLIGIGIWLVASLGLKFYVADFANYNVAYGSMGAVIVLLLWFYLGSIAILAGAEVNAMLNETADGEREGVEHGDTG